MTFPVCLSYTVQDLESILNSLPAQYASEDLIEIYVDYLTEAAQKALPTFLEAIPYRTILTFRRPQFAPQQNDFAKRCELLRSIAFSKAIVDLDIHQEKLEIEYCREQKLPLSIMTSFHDYRGTPSHVELVRIYQQMQHFDPRYVKFACACVQDEDCVTLLSLLATIQKDSRRYIVTGMLEKGKVVRLAAAHKGNAWTYVMRDIEGATAPGQFTYEEFKDLIELC